MLKKKSSWIYKQTKNAKEVTAVSLEAVSGECIQYLGIKYKLDVVSGGCKGLVFCGDRFIINKVRDDAFIKSLNGFYRQKAKEVLLEKIAFFSGRMGVAPKAIKIIKMKNRWGSCTSSGNILFNSNIMQLPSNIIDYIVVHELAHLIEHNHSEQFWRVVKVQIPDYKSAERWLTATDSIFINN